MRRLYRKMVSELKWNDDACILLTCPERERLQAEIERLRAELAASARITNGSENTLSAYLKLEAERNELRTELAAERERCAKIVDEWHDHNGDWVSKIAAAIRRGEL